MARNTTPAPASKEAPFIEEAARSDIAAANQLAVATLEQNERVSALAVQLNYQGSTDPAVLVNSAKDAIRRIGMGVFELGAYLLDKHHHLRVDVHNPQLEIMVEIRDYAAYVHGPKVEAAGGLPVGTSGRALNLLSGGIDSPVAAYRMAKRGLALDHIHFASPPYTSERAKLKVKALAQLTSIYTGSSNLFVVPYTKPQEYIRDNAPDVLFTVLMRRSMMRIANVIAKKQGCEALVTGESLAQVASQTVKALQCTDAAQDLPILRPLIGMDKTEIIETSRHIGTYETSILPYEDCCTIFTPPHPKIRPELAEILEAEAAMPGLAELEAEAAENTERIRIRITDEIEFEG